MGWTFIVVCSLNIIFNLAVVIVESIYTTIENKNVQKAAKKVAKGRRKMIKAEKMLIEIGVINEDGNDQQDDRFKLNPDVL